MTSLWSWSCSCNQKLYDEVQLEEQRRGEKKKKQNTNQNRGMPSKSFKVRNSFSLCQWLWFSRIKIKVLTVGRALTNAELSLWKPGTSATVRLCLDEHGLLVPALANSAPERLHQSWSMKSEASKLQRGESNQTPADWNWTKEV